MNETEKRKKLYALAEEDTIYMTWKRSFEEHAEAFLEFASMQDETRRNVLFGYADSGRLMMQRIVNIACHAMDFSKETENK